MCAQMGLPASRDCNFVRGTQRPMTHECLVIVPEGKIGHLQQCIGVADALGMRHSVAMVRAGALGRLLAPHGQPARRDRALVSTPAELVLVSGRQAIPFARAIARRPAPRPFVAVLGAPRLSPNCFDFVWTNAHDRLPPAENVLTTLTSPHCLTRESLSSAGEAFARALAGLPRPWIGVLVGGSSHAYRFGTDEADELATALATLADARGGSLLVTTSRRTGRANREHIARRLAGAPGGVWDGQGENPIYGMLATADALLVTCDSVNMLSEATFTGKPVYAWPLPGGSTRSDRFLDGLMRHGAMRWFDGRLESWSYRPLDATAEIAGAIAARLRTRRDLALRPGPLEYSGDR